MRILAVDPGEKRIGIAISDPTAMIASPLCVINHHTRPLDAQKIVDLATQNQVGMIVIGTSTDEDGNPTMQSKSADRLAEAIQARCNIPLAMWDESFSTVSARQARIDMGVSRHKRRGHLDESAAAVILQSYLDSKIG